MFCKVPFPNAVLFLHLMGKMFQDTISFPAIGWLCVSVGLFAAIGSETEIQFACRLEIATVLYLHCSRGQKLAHDVKNDCTNILHTAEVGNTNLEERTSLEEGISVRILPDASQSCPEVYKPCICLGTVIQG